MRRRRPGPADRGRRLPLVASLGLAGLLAAGCAPQSLYSATGPSGSASSGPGASSASGAAGGASTASGTSAGSSSDAAPSSPSTSPAASGGSASGSPSSAAAATVTISAPLRGGLLLTDSPIKAGVTGGTLTALSVTAGGRAVAGDLSTSAATWTPKHPLAYGTTYQVAATATNAQGRATTVTKSFTTISPTSTVVITGTTPSSGRSVGDAQPMVVQFSAPITNKAAVQKALTLTDTAHVTGAWRWLSDTRVDYRPKTFWPLGDKVTLTARLAGVQAGAHLWGSGSYSSTFTVTSDLHAVVDAAKHTMTVWQGGKQVRTLKTGTGMPQFSTWNGAMVVLQKVPKVRMTSCSIGISCTPGTTNYYDLQVYQDVQLTPSGTYVHAAPWDNKLGVANTSHGCIHLSDADAAWFYSHVQEGDLVTVKNAGRQVPITNGEGDWNLSWSQWTA